MNYATLFETIQGYTENTFPSTSVNDTSAAATTFTGKEQIDTFIRQAEQRIYNVVLLDV
jgi:predicted Zn-dependent protease